MPRETKLIAGVLLIKQTWAVFCTCLAFFLIINVSFIGCSKGSSTVSKGQINFLIQQATDYMDRGFQDNNGEQFRKAQKPLEQAMKLEPDNYKVLLAFASYYQNDKWENKEKQKENIAMGDALLEKIERFHKKDPVAMLALADYCNTPLLAEMRPAAPPSNMSQNELADDIAPGRRPKKAVRCYRSVLDIDPKNWYALTSLGKAYLSQKQYKEAEEVFSDCIRQGEAESDEHKIRYGQEFLGRTYIKQNRFQKAEEILKRSTDGLEEYNRKHEQYWGCPYQALGQLYSKMGDVNRGKEYYIKAADIEKDTALSQFMAATICYEAKDLDCALTYINRSLAIEQNDATIDFKKKLLDKKNGHVDADRNEIARQWVAAASAFFEHGDFDEAMKQLNRISDKEKIPDAMALKGYLLLFRRDYQAARELFEKLNKINSKTQGALIGLGHLDVIEKNYDVAQKRFQKALNEMNPVLGPADRNYSTMNPAEKIDFKMACLGMGWLLANQNRHLEAISYYDRILDHETNHLLALLGKGNSFSGLKRLGKAEALFQKVLKRHPENQYALAELAIVRYNRGDDEGAEQAFKAALAVDDQNYTCPYEGLGLVYLRQGKMEIAKKNFEKAIELNPNIEYKKFNGLAKIYIKEGKLEKARELLEKSIANYPYDGEASKLLNDINEMNQK